MEKLRLYVSVYKAQVQSSLQFTVPVSAGAALYGGDIVPMDVRDDTGENISDRNPQYCELTVQYWAWKQLRHQTEMPEYVGFMHRRRYFDFSDTHPLSRDNPVKTHRPYRIFNEPDEKTLERICFNQDKIMSVISGYRFIAPLRENIFHTVLEQYNKNDRREFDDMGLLCEIIKDKYPEYSAAAGKYLKGTYGYYCNMFISDREMLDVYCTWLFDILSEYDRCKPKEMMYPREQGKLAERLFGIFMTYIKTETDIRWAELPRAHFAKLEGATANNNSFNRLTYSLFPPDSLRRRIIKKLKG